MNRTSTAPVPKENPGRRDAPDASSRAFSLFYVPPLTLAAPPPDADVQPAPPIGTPLTVIALIHQLAASLGAAIDAKDPHTLAHSEEVALLSRRIALAMGLSETEADIVHVAGHLHDIGKIGLPDAVLAKPGPPSPEEWALIKTHPRRGADILRHLSCLADTGVVGMVHYHHERFDGRGYPSGLHGPSIPLGARIIAVADSFSAMLQTRPYRASLPPEAVFAEIGRASGGQFDPAVVRAFFTLGDQALAIIRRADPPASPEAPRAAP